jgi:hypothetical protein
MPTYGLANGAIASKTNRHRNEKRLPMRTTKPVRLSQFRNIEVLLEPDPDADGAEFMFDYWA